MTLLISINHNKYNISLLKQHNQSKEPIQHHNTQQIHLQIIIININNNNLLKAKTINQHSFKIIITLYKIKLGQHKKY